MADVPNTSSAQKSFEARTHGKSLPVNGLSTETEIARVNLRGTTYFTMTIIGDMVCRIYRDQNQYRVCVSAENHPSFERCGYEASGRNVVGMLAMNEMLEQLRADCEWLDSLPEGALMEPGQSVLQFLLTYLGHIFVDEYSENGLVPERLQRALDRIQKTRMAVIVGESINPAEMNYIAPVVIRTADEHHVFINDSLMSKEEDGKFREELNKPILPPKE